MTSATTPAPPELTLGGGALAAAAPESVRTGMDEREFHAFHDATSRPLWAYLASASGSPALADDLVQESYYRLLRASFQAESERHRKNYLFRIATNLLRDHYRRRRLRTRPAREGDAVQAPSPRLHLRTDLQRLLGELRQRDRQLLWLAHGEGLSHREVASILGLREASVRPMLFRARQRLAARLREEGWGPETPR